MDIYVYFGAGYGERKQVWQTIHDGYLTYMPSYHSNVSGDLGILFSYKKKSPLSTPIKTSAFNCSNCFKAKAPSIVPPLIIAPVLFISL